MRELRKDMQLVMESIVRPANRVCIDSDHAPISTNMLFFNIAGRGRVPSDRYKTWRNAVGYDFNGHGSLADGPFAVRLTIHPKKRRKGSDLDNRIKCVMDMLVAHKIVPDDSKCEYIELQYGECPKAFRVEVWPL
jgi:Holliday junction resolvase RusA-like endonuclease